MGNLCFVECGVLRTKPTINFQYTHTHTPEINSNLHVCRGAYTPTSNLHVCRGAYTPTSNLHVCRGAYTPTSNLHVCRGAYTPTSNLHVCRGAYTPWYSVAVHAPSCSVQSRTNAYESDKDLSRDVRVLNSELSRVSPTRHQCCCYHF